MGGSRRVGVQVLRTKIGRGIVAVGLAALIQAAMAQFGQQRPGEGVSAPAQTPTITNAPAATKDFLSNSGFLILGKDGSIIERPQDW